MKIIILMLAFLLFGLIKIDGDSQVRLTLFVGDKCIACHKEDQYLSSKGAEYQVQNINVNGAAKNFVQNRNGGQLTVPLLWDSETATSLVGFSTGLVDGFLEGLG